MSQCTPALLLWEENAAAAAAVAAVAPTGPVAAVTQLVVVHPLVLLHVLDHHTRRQNPEGRVIGTLLGRRDGNKVEVTNCFAVPHAERGDEVAIGKDYNKQMLALHLRANRKEVVVGWYATTTSSPTSTTTTAEPNAPTAMIADTSSLIHEFYASETEDGEPVHLVVDTQLNPSASNNGDDALVPMFAFQSTPVALGGEPLANLFHQVRLVVQATGPESISLHHMIQAMDRPSSTVNSTNHDNGAPTATDGDTTTNNHDAVQDDVKESPTASLLVSMERLYQLLDTASRHVDAVVAGHPTDAAITPEVGRQIAATLSTVPRVRPDVFDRLFHDSLQDLLMVTYLSNITRTQLTIAEKLNACLGI